jgi:hypothetical protein
MAKSRFLNKSEDSTIETENLDLDSIQRKDEKEQLVEQITILQDLYKRDKATIKDLKEVISNGSFIAAEQILSKTNTTGENILFEFSLEIEEVKQHVTSITNKNGVIEKLWFNGSLNKDTGEVLEIFLGRMTAK